MNVASMARRFAIAAIGIVTAGFILRPQLADALVFRGDERLYRGDLQRALQYYRRALVFDAMDGVAIDRLLFVGRIARNRIVLDGITLAGTYLVRNPADAVVRMDRAMAYRSAGNLRAALSDFETVGLQRRDPRALALAGWLAHRLGLRSRAIALWKSTLMLAPAFPLAKHGLARVLGSHR